MLSYNFMQWVMFFYIYCFIGWIIESSIVSIEKRKFVNRGFLRGPYLPLYGFGAITILLITLPVAYSPPLVYLIGMIGTTVLEYITGAVMEAIFKMKYWDYSKQKFNYKGRISLLSSMFWGFLSLLLTFFLHKPIEHIVLTLYSKNIELFTVIITVISFVFLSDMIYAFKTAFDVNKLLKNIERIKTEIYQIKNRLDERIESDENSEKLCKKILNLNLEHLNLIKRIGYFSKNFINAHPNAVSIKFNETLVELREHLNKKRT